MNKIIELTTVPYNAKILVYVNTISTIKAWPSVSTENVTTTITTVDGNQHTVKETYDEVKQMVLGE